MRFGSAPSDVSEVRRGSCAMADTHILMQARDVDRHDFA
jgi:hypothetical protein